MKKTAWNAHNWTPEKMEFLVTNYQKLTNPELAKQLGFRLTAVRMKLYELGCKRMELEYWTEEQIEFLKENYQTIGDSELAEIFAQFWTKQKGWTKKHIEKKRRYLKLKRTEAEKTDIHDRNVKAGRFAMCPVKAWETRGISKPGEQRIWRVNGYKVCVIKTEGGWKKLAHHNYELSYGPIAKDHIIRHIDGNTLNCDPANLEMITKAENGIRNGPANLSDNYVLACLTFKQPELREQLRGNTYLIDLKRTQLLFNREIQKHEKSAGKA
jgi:hypothetical protein